MTESFLVIGAKADTRDWQRNLERFAAQTGQSLKRVVRAEARTVLKLLYTWTPPQGGQAQGEGAVARDVHRIFTGKPRGYLEMVADHFGTRQVKQVLRRKDGSTYLVDVDVIDLSGQGMAAFHASHRLVNGTVSVAGLADQKTGRWKASEEMWVPTDVLQRYLELVKGRVGLSRAGWLPAMDALGVPAASWVTRLRGSGGSVENRLNDPIAPRFVAGNDLGFFRTGSGGEALVQRVFRTRAEHLAAAIDKAVTDTARQTGAVEC